MTGRRLGRSSLGRGLTGGGPNRRPERRGGAGRKNYAGVVGRTSPGRGLWGVGLREGHAEELGRKSRIGAGPNGEGQANGRSKEEEPGCGWEEDKV